MRLSAYLHKQRKFTPKKNEVKNTFTSLRQKHFFHGKIPHHQKISPIMYLDKIK